MPIEVSGDTGSIFDTFVIEPSETAWEAIARATRMRGLLAFTAGTGTLRLAPAGAQGKTEAELVYGVNVKSFDFKVDHKPRFQTYIVRGQQPGSDSIFGAGSTAIEGQATDDAIHRPRSIILLADSNTSEESANARAQWEASARAARSTVLEVVVDGWRQYDEGPLWRLNTVVPVTIGPLEMRAEDWLIGEIKYSRREDQGTLTEMTLMRTDAYKPQPTLQEEEDPAAFMFGGDR